MRRCTKCGAIVADDATSCGICGEDLSSIEPESLQDAVANEEKALLTEGEKMQQEELASEKRDRKTILVFYGMLVGLIVVGIVLTTVRSDILNLTGIVLILFALAFVVVLGRGPSARVGWMRRRIRP
jgi:uncharacterized membrane protein YvbJ